MITLTEHQQGVFNNILNDVESFNDFNQCFVGSLTGPAGTGKTVMTSKLIDYFLNNTSHNIVATTPTHKSLKVLNDMVPKNTRILTKTIHSYLGLKMQAKEDKMVLTIDNMLKTDKKPYKILIVDESSMVSEELYKYIEKRIKSSNLQVVLFIGDPIQLLPVEGGKNPVYTKIRQYELKEVVRQAKDSSILMEATKLRKQIENNKFDRKNIMSIKTTADIEIFKSETELLKDFCLNPERDKILSSFTNIKTDYYNSFARAYDYREFNPIPEYIEGEVLTMQEAYYPGMGDSGIRNGDEVVITALNKNFDDKTKLYYWEFKNFDNDVDIKIISGESKERYQQLLKYISDKANTFKRDKYFKECSDMWDKFWKFKSQYAEVKYSYSSTIHKLQGSSYNEVYLNLKDTLYSCRDDEMLFRLVYVALTRARKKIKLFI